MKSTFVSLQYQAQQIAECAALAYWTECPFQKERLRKALARFEEARAAADAILAVAEDDAAPELGAMNPIGE